ncbi:bZIP transcription factor 44, partial [Mucuna pruriens]
MKSKFEGENGEVEKTERKKRRESECEYERQLQMEKQKQLEDLTNKFNKLQCEKKKLMESIKAKKEACAEVEVDNNILRAQFAELANLLRFFK